MVLSKLNSLKWVAIGILHFGDCPVRADSENPILRTETEARSGVTGQNVRYVLLWSTLATVAAMAAPYLVFIRDHV